MVFEDDFSTFDGENGFSGWEIDGAGTATFRDDDVFCSGKASLRMEFSRGCGRILAVKFIDLPTNCGLRMTIRLKSSGVDLPYRFTTLVYDGRTKFHGGVFGRARSPVLKPVDGWFETSIPLEVKDTPEAMVAIGSWTLESGTVWLDNVRIDRGAGGAPAFLDVAYDRTLAEPRTLSNPDFYLWYLDRLAEVKAAFPDARRWILATERGDGSPLAEDMRQKAVALASLVAGSEIGIEMEDA